MKFRLLHGRHMEGGCSFDGRGDKKPIIESDTPLDVVFANKFTQVSDALPAVNGKPMRTPSIKDQAEEKVQQEVQQEEEKESEVDKTPEPVMTLKAIHKGRGRWDVVKVIDGEVTDECVNEEFLKKAGATEMVEAGYKPEYDEED